jgi:hypothetical protein
MSLNESLRILEKTTLNTTKFRDLHLSGNLSFAEKNAFSLEICHELIQNFNNEEYWSDPRWKQNQLRERLSWHRHQEKKLRKLYDKVIKDMCDPNLNHLMPELKKEEKSLSAEIESIVEDRGDIETELLK